MIGFRFKITFETDDSFSREAELSSNYTFEDFHYLITEDMKINSSKPSSFYLCDHKFRKKQEISLNENTHNKINESIVESDDEDVYNKQNKPTSPLIMKNHTLSDLIDDPHQKLIYIFDHEQSYIFYIELLKLFPVSNNSICRIIKQTGGIPLELQPPKNISQNVNENNEDGMDDEDISNHEDEEQYIEDTDNLSIDGEQDDLDDSLFDQDEPENDK